MLFKRGVKGEVRTWRMELEGSRHRVISGILGGVETPSGWTQCVAKRGTTPEQQAEAEVKANYAKKLTRGYFEDIDQIDNVPFTKPMLANTYSGWPGQPVLAQPKLDGVRCIARADGLWTRTGKPITAVPHIHEALTPYFEADPDLILDGELYNHELKDDFGALVSLIRKKDPVPEAAEIVQYHIYDRVWDKDGDRLLPMSFDHPFLKRVQTKWVDTEERLDELYARWLELGYEGQMVRLLGFEYEHKRSKGLLKRKEFLSDEFPVLRIEEGLGNWAGCAKRFIFQLPDGRECGAGVRGTQESLAALLQGPTPTWATVRYFTPTPDGFPRFPVVTDWGFTTKRED